MDTGKGARRTRSEDRSNAFLTRARVSLKEGKEDDYRKDLKQAVESWGDNTAALDLLSAEYLKDRKYDEAIVLLKSIDARSRPRRPATVIEIAKCYHLSGRTVEGRKFLQSALKDKYLAKSESIYLELGRFFQEEKTLQSSESTI